MNIRNYEIVTLSDFRGSSASFSKSWQSGMLSRFAETEADEEVQNRNDSNQPILLWSTGVMKTI
jgi:hypothetical protein